MKHTKSAHEQVSALADGYLRDEEFASVVDKLGTDNELLDAWRNYHLVGDVLRTGTHSACGDTTAFLARFQQRLAVEPSAPIVAPELAEVPRRRVEAANEPVFRWKLVAGAASLAAAAAISWNWIGSTGPASGQMQIAQQQQQQLMPQRPNSVLSASNPGQQLTATRVAVGNGNPQIMLRDPRLDQMLEAHRQAGGASQMPSTFLRDATFEGPSR